jgi:glycosyltransferase involved in cell wall biosynthesis
LARIRKIVIINQDSGYLIIDIANALSDKGCEVSLITGRLVVRNRVLSKVVNQKKIIRYNRNTKFLRIATWIIGFLQIIFLVITKFRRDYLVIVSNPPLNSFLPLICRNRFSMIVFDIYPDALIEVGISSAKSLGINSWRKINQKLYPRADNIFTLTEGMAARLSLYAREQSVKVIPVWTDNEFIKPLPKWLNPFVKEYSLLNKFVVLYSGNLGMTHNIEIIPKLASLVDNPDVLFLIIGDGDKRHWLKEINEKRTSGIVCCCHYNLLR